jgi:hypothetical protein
VVRERLVPGSIVARTLLSLTPAAPEAAAAVQAYPAEEEEVK